MKSVWSLLLTLALTLGDGAESAPHNEAPPAWAGYSGQASWTEFLDYPVLVFDATSHPPVRPLNGRGKEVFARLHFVPEADGKMVQPYVYGLQSLETPEAIHRIMENDVPELVREGFDGLLLDMDTQAGNLSLSENVRLVIRRLEIQYPYLKLMLSTSPDNLFDTKHPGYYLMVRVKKADISDENINITIRNIRNYIKLFPQKILLISIESDKPSLADCKAFAKLKASCFATAKAWNKTPGEVK